jgi:predicted O-methyltransferase YrrM
MLSPEELGFLHFLVRDHWYGRGDILELGPWLGASTVAMARGMRREGTLHTVDAFIWQTHMADRATIALKPGRSFRPVLEAHLGPLLGRVHIHEERLPDDASGALRFGETVAGDIPVLQLEDRPIELVFVDGAKSWLGFRTLL